MRAGPTLRVAGAVACAASILVAAAAGAAKGPGGERCVADRGAHGCARARPGSLDGARALALSRDGRDAYVASAGAGSVTRIDVAGGALTVRGCTADRGSHGCAGGGVHSLAGASGIAVSPDGRDVYVASFRASAVTAMRRTPGGGLRVLGCVADGGRGGCAAPAGDSLDGAGAIALSGDGRSAYVASYYSGSITAFARNRSTGALADRGCAASGREGGCAAIPNDSLRGASGVAVSPDGRSVYVVSAAADTIVSFARDASDGSLTYRGCIANVGAAGCARAPLRSLGDPLGVAVSPDGRSVYVASAAGDSLTWFRRQRRSGRIGERGCIANRGRSGCADPPRDSLAGAGAVAVAPGGDRVYVAGGLGDSLTTLRRRPATGRVAFAACLANRGRNGCRDLPHDSLGGAAGVAAAPSGGGVFVASQGADAVTRIGRGCGGGSGCRQHPN